MRFVYRERGSRGRTQTPTAAQSLRLRLRLRGVRRHPLRDIAIAFGARVRGNMAAQKELKLDVGDDAVTAFMYVPASVRALRRPESVKKLSHT